MGRGKSKLKKQTQNTSRSYDAGGNNGYSTKPSKSRIDNALAKTKGYDSLTKNEKENRGRKKKK